MSRLQQLQEQAQAAAKAAREVAEKAAAENRSLTEEEKATYDREMAKGRDLLEQVKAAKADEAVLAEARKLAEEIGGGAPDDVDAQAGKGTDTRPRGKRLEQVVVTSEQYKAMIGQYPGGRIPDRARVQSDPIPVKSLFTGASDTSGGAFVVADQSGIVEMLGRRPLVIRDVISVRRTGSDAVEYVRQTSHTNNAAPVAEATTAALPTQDGSTGPLVQAAGGGYKPEGAWAFERDSTPVRTIAEWVPATKRALADVAQLEGLIRDELSADLAETEETEIMSGSGSGEHLTGILNTSGTQAQAWSNNILETLRKAITKARVTGRSVPNGIGLNPADVETIDLLQDNEGRYYGMGPFAMGPRTVWGVPIVESEAVPSGTGVVADWSKAVLWDREQATVTMTDSHADFFIRNLVAILGEERVAFAVTRPSAFVIADLTA